MDHAKLSPSSASRWLACPASVRLGAEYPRTTNSFAEEGTAAHTLAEIKARYRFIHRDKSIYDVDHQLFVEANEQFYNEDMERHTEALILEIERSLDRRPAAIFLEQTVNTGIDGCWGTGDVVLVGAHHIHVIDLKYGTGVRVDCEKNAQMMLYGLGALDMFGDLLGEVEEITLTVFQPRIGNVSSWTCSADDLRTWREEIRPVAAEALAGSDRFGPSESACRFCPAKGDCRARVEAATAEDFGQAPERISLDELGDLLGRLPGIKAWCADVEEYALAQASAGKAVPGWKVVRTHPRRQIKDPAAAVQTLIDAGYSAEQVAEFKTRKLGDLDKLVGKDKLKELLGDLLGMTPGSPTLVPESDQRPSLDKNAEAAKDFACEA